MLGVELFARHCWQSVLGLGVPGKGHYLKCLGQTREGFVPLHPTLLFTFVSHDCCLLGCVFWGGSVALPFSLFIPGCLSIVSSMNKTKSAGAHVCAGMFFTSAFHIPSPRAESRGVFVRLAQGDSNIASLVWQQPGHLAGIRLIIYVYFYYKKQVMSLLTL